MIRPPLFSVTRDTNSCTKDNGMVAMIPTVISKDIPFPIPLSVIFSPSHIKNMVPVTNMITEVIMKIGPFQEGMQNQEHQEHPNHINMLVPVQHRWQWLTNV